jgi:hypothetical protein
MNLEQFRTNLLAWKGAAIVTIHAETEPDLIKTGNPYTGITKRSAVNGVINWVYERAVNNQRLREDLEADFRAHPRKWGKRIIGTPLVEHNGKYYLEMKVQQSACRYFIGGKEINTADVTPWLRPRKPSRQGVSKEVILRDYSLENITCFIYGEAYPIG